MSAVIGIVGVEARRDHAIALADETDASLLSISTLDAGNHHLNVWNELNTYGSEWAVVLEDDAMPCEDFRVQLDMALAVAPTPLVSLYLGRAKPPHVQDCIAQVIADPEDPSWLMADMLYHHVGVALKNRYVEDMTDNVRVFLNKHPIDEAVGLWARQRNFQVAYTNPSLVDHHWQLPSEIMYRTRDGQEDRVERAPDPEHPRRAWRTGPRDTWDVSQLTIPSPIEYSPGRFVPF